MSQALVVCPYCGCGCSFYIEEKDGRAVGVTPSMDHPVSRGSLCVKGWRAYEFINHPERLRSPMIRDGGLVREATWEEATDLIVENLLDIKESMEVMPLHFYLPLN